MRDRGDQSLKRRQLNQGVTMLLTAVLALILCVCLYTKDNQYADSCQQPSNGVLDLREADLENQNSRPYHLYQDWEFYPEVLLMPEDDFSLYPHSLRSLQEIPGDPWEGQGTYRLTLLLPDTPMSYALKLPTPFSDYRLYVDQALTLTIGKLGAEGGGQDLFKGQVLTFRASGEVRLVLHYSDQSGIHHGLNGLSAPPILGRPLRIYSIVEYHSSFLVISMVLILLTLLLSISLFFRSKQASNLAMIFLCLCAAIYLSYPMVRSEVLIPIYPWHRMSILFYFGFHAATHWTYSHHFGWKDAAARFIDWYSVAALSICAGILFFSVFLPREQGGQLFYGGIRMLEWGSVFCGVLLSLRMVVAGAPNRLMGAASVTLWLFLLMDLILPSFSPVISVRLPIMGVICFMDITILVEYADVASAHQFRILYTQRMAHAEQLLKLEERHYAQLSDQVEDARRVRHDLRQHLRVIRSLLERGDAEEISNYLEQYLETVQPLLTKPMSFYQVPVVDALIAYYWEAAQKRGVDFQVHGQLRSLPQEVYVDFCSILGNLLENALEAMDRQEPDRPKWIQVRCEILQKKVMLEVVNANSVPVRQEEERFQSAKRDALGTGTLSISIIARQYGGLSSFTQEGDHFTARVLLPLSGLHNREDRRSGPG